MNGVVRKFGVSGYLYNSDVLLWDDCSESFWSQVEGKAVVGPETDTELEWLHVVDTTFAKFKEDHPKGEVLKGPNPRRAYAFDPYKARGYDKDDSPGFLPKDKADKRMHQKAVVTGVTVGDATFCVPHKEIAKVETPVKVKVGEETLELSYDAEADAVAVTKDGESVVTMRAYWFAWAVFHPETLVFEVTEDMKLKEKEEPKEAPKEDESEEEEEFQVD